ncbi:MAG: molecular chaperone TorD family protein [Albidovulum sp.]|nr:molecular chaperone TorD family protein [Albidovulum sp.]MDE0533126.1 molecular chaperone TorD family protein [Albidovulum sp.]
MTADENQPGLAEEEKLRADLYAFLSAILAAPPEQDLIEKISQVRGDDTRLGKAVQTMSRMARVATPKSVEREFNALFIGVGRGELLPYGSYYLTGFLNEKPLARLRNDMSRLGIARTPNVFEPEDNIASLFEIMSALVTGAFGAPASLALQKVFFERHIETWAEHFFVDLEGAKNSVFYAPVGSVGREFMEIEKESFRLAGEPSKEELAELPIAN